MSNDANVLIMSLPKSQGSSDNDLFISFKIGENHWSAPKNMGFRAPAPDADSYVEIGAVVQEKSVLCIIEAMKLMNEIESDIAGKVVKILAENGQAVEYNQPLFLIDPA